LKALRYALALAAAGVVGYLFWPLLGEVRASADLLAELRPGWLGLALVLQVLSYACLTNLNYQMLRPFPGRISFLRLMAVLPAMAFIEVAVPSAGASGAVLRARLLGRSGYSLETSTFTLIAENFFEVLVGVVASLAGLWYLLQAGEVWPAEALLAGLALLLALAASRSAWQAIQKRQRIQRRLLRLQARWNRIARRLRRPPASPLKLLERVRDFYAGLARLRQVRMRTFWLSSAGHMTLDVVSLGACFAAFGYVMPAGTLLTGYGLMLLLSGLAGLPGGLGIADASAAVIFARLGTPGAVALAGALVYRLMAFWLLRLIGLAAWQVLEAQRGTPAPDPAPL
jgi:uncharacterized protein (TIRG00374 family)